MNVNSFSLCFLFYFVSCDSVIAGINHFRFLCYSKVNSQPQTTVQTANHEFALLFDLDQIILGKTVAALVPATAGPVPRPLSLVKVQVVQVDALHAGLEPAALQAGSRLRR